MLSSRFSASLCACLRCFLLSRCPSLHVRANYELRLIRLIRQPRIFANRVFSRFSCYRKLRRETKLLFYALFAPVFTDRITKPCGPCDPCGRSLRPLPCVLRVVSFRGTLWRLWALAALCARPGCSQHVPGRYKESPTVGRAPSKRRNCADCRRHKAGERPLRGLV